MTKSLVLAACLIGLVSVLSFSLSFNSQAVVSAPLAPAGLNEASDDQPLSPPDEDKIEEELEAIRKMIKEKGYKYTVTKNWIMYLSPEKRKALCGYKHLEAPKAPPTENIRFLSDVPKIETEQLGQPLGEPPSSYDAIALGYVTPIKNQLLDIRSSRRL